MSRKNDRISIRRFGVSVVNIVERFMSLTASGRRVIVWWGWTRCFNFNFGWRRICIGIVRRWYVLHVVDGRKNTLHITIVVVKSKELF